jgi:flagellar protein FlaI
LDKIWFSICETFDAENIAIKKYFSEYSMGGFLTRIFSRRKTSAEPLVARAEKIKSRISVFEIEKLFQKSSKIDIKGEFSDKPPSISFRGELLIETYDDEKLGPLVKFSPPEGFEEIRRYWIQEPYVFASIIVNKKTGEYIYHLVEPELSSSEKRTLDLVFSYLQDLLLVVPPESEKEKVLRDTVLSLLKKLKVPFTPQLVHKILYYVRRRYLGYDTIDALMRDPNIEDISCDGANVPIFLFHREFGNIRTNIIFDEEDLNLFVIRLAELAGKHISLGRPIVEATLPDGSRLHLTLGRSVTTRGSSFSIRRFGGKHFTPVDLIRLRTFSSEMLAYLWLMAEHGKNILVIGPTASGKTSTLNALAFFIPPDAKIISIEDTRELLLYQENWVPYVAREAFGEAEISLESLLRQAIRQRPECIIVGEVRGREAVIMFQAMALGHTAFATMHAGGINEMVTRLTGAPIGVPFDMLSLLNVVCIQLLIQRGREKVRRNMQVVEILGIEKETRTLRTNIVYSFNPSLDNFEHQSKPMYLEEIARIRGWDLQEVIQELERRKRLLDYLVEKNILDAREITSFLNRYYYSPEETARILDEGTQA